MSEVALSFLLKVWNVYFWSLSFWSCPVFFPINFATKGAFAIETQRSRTVFSDFSFRPNWFEPQNGYNIFKTQSPFKIQLCRNCMLKRSMKKQTIVTTRRPFVYRFNVLFESSGCWGISEFPFNQERNYQRWNIIILVRIKYVNKTRSEMIMVRENLNHFHRSRLNRPNNSWSQEFYFSIDSLMEVNTLSSRVCYLSAEIMSGLKRKFQGAIAPNQTIRSRSSNRIFSFLFCSISLFALHV